MDSKQVEDKILQLVADICGDSCIWDERDLDLFEEGLFDSMAAIEFLVSVEDEFGVAIAPTELERDEMNTPNKIVARIIERM